MVTENTMSKNVSEAAISLDRISRSLDDIVDRLDEVEKNQRDTHSGLEELAAHYESTRKVGFMERLEGLSPKMILGLIALASSLMGGGVLSIDTFLERNQPVVQQVEQPDWQNRDPFPSPNPNE